MIGMMETKLEDFFLNCKKNFKMCNLKNHFTHFEKCKENMRYKAIMK